MCRALLASTVAISGLAACATPGIDYETRIMPANLAAAETRTVQVDRFRGPAGGWYADRFASMLANATLDGEPWFRLADFRYGGPGEGPAGTYTGHIDIDDYSVSEYTQTVSKCTEWDGLFDCETREDVEELCISESVSVSVTPRLIDADTGQIMFSKSYGGEAGRDVCDEDHYHGFGGLFGSGRGAPPPELVREALLETLRPIRNDIAPRNATVRAKFVREAYDPMVKADPRFEQAVKAGTRDPFAACDTWTAMAAQYPQAPAVIHNMGACAEASHDFEAAHGLYAQAAELAVKYGEGGTSAPKAFVQSLRRLSDHRFGLELIEDLTGERDYLPVTPEGESVTRPPQPDEAGS
ncbi:MAG: hypothetical protein GYB42_12080 [Alphaproteobacteria bacterium]|nr:hypothetical protein [Alphaproteobacteria bacterium]